MVIKKYKSGSPQTTELKKRLEAYTRQGRSYRKTQKGNPLRGSSLLKTTLAAVIPLAAAGSIQAQCQGSTAGFTSTGTYVLIDIDGVAPFNDIQVYIGTVGFTLLYPANGFHVEDNSTAGMFLSAGFEVTRGQSFGTVFKCDNCDGLGYLKVRKGDNTTGQPGWIKVQFTSSTPEFRIVERGVEIDGDNSAITDQCATMAPAMPVELTHFRTSPQDKHIQLEWATASELNNEGFEVQRSTDGRNFAKIGWVGGRGTTQEEQTYRFLDDEVQPNTKYYYRLRQMDTDGTSDFSPVRSAMVEDASMVQVSEFFPNPVGKGRAAARFKLNMPEEGQMDIQVFDARGGLVKELTREYAAGRSTLGVPVRDLVAGQYFVKMQLGQEVVYRKLVVK